MSWTDWLANLFRYKPKPNYWETLYRDEKSLSDKYFYQNQKLVADIARLKSDLSLAIDQISKLNASVKSLEKRNQALQGQLMVADNAANITDSLAKKLEDAENKLNESSAIVEDLKVQLEIANNKLAVAQEITPESLTKYLKDKYKDISDKSKFWDLWETSIMFAFAVENTEEAVVIPAQEYKERLIKAFPNAVFHSALKDNLYYTCSMNQAEIIIRNDFGNLKPYIAEKYDCDKFAQSLRVHFYSIYGYNNIVEAWGNSPFGFHSWIKVNCHDGILMVEPQTDSITRLPNILPGYETQAFHDL